MQIRSMIADRYLGVAHTGNIWGSQASRDDACICNLQHNLQTSVRSAYPNQAAYVKQTPQLPYQDPSDLCILSIYFLPRVLELLISSAR